MLHMRIKIMLLSLLATLIIADGRARGYMLVFQGGYCGGLGQTLGTDIVDPQDCYRLAKKHKATGFSMGRGYRRGKCCVELLDFDCGNYKQWQVCVPTPLAHHTHGCMCL